MSTNDQLKELFDIYLSENERFEEKGVMVSASRARKALAEISKLAKQRRAELLEERSKVAESK